MTEQLYTQEQIVNHLENCSPTKFMYSFGRAERFPALKRRGTSDNFYDLPSVRMNRTAGFGYGHRYDFTKNKNGIELTSVKRDYDPGSIKRGPSFSFGLSRDKFMKQVCPGYRNVDRNIPGPGKYNFLRPFGSDAPKYTCGPRTWKSVSKNINPGPDTYMPVIKINESGRCPVSKYSNVIGVISFANDKSMRSGLKRKL